MEIAILAVNKAFPGYGSYALNTFLQKILNESWIRQGQCCFSVISVSLFVILRL